jgi:PAS domain S-box-containing protein
LVRRLEVEQLKSGEKKEAGLAPASTPSMRSEHVQIDGAMEHLILQSVRDFAIFTVNRDRIVTAWYPGAEQLFGYDADEIIGKSADILFTEEDREADAPRKEVEQALTTGCGSDERWHVRKDGTRTFLSGSVRAMRNGKGELVGLAKVARDITRKKRLEEDLRASEEHLQLILESATDYAISTLSLDGVIRTWNTGAERIFGYTAEEMIGRTGRILFVPEDQQHRQDLQEIDIALKNGRAENERWQQRKDGSRLWASGLMLPMKDAEGRPVACLKILRDWTQQRLAEQNLEKMVAERTAKLRELVGELEAFSYSIAHDMRAPLRAMQGFAHMLEEELDGERKPRVNEYLRRISTSAHRLDLLIEDVLNYSKIVRAELHLEPVDANAIVREIIESYPNLQEADIQVEGTLPPVMGGRAALTQVIANLLGNSVKFVKPGAKAKIRIRAEDRDGFVRLWFKDNGIGIPREAHERVFQMLQRINSRDEYEGTGIGLAIVRKAVERMSGRVGVESEVGVGSKFWIDLQRAP